CRLPRHRHAGDDRLRGGPATPGTGRPERSPDRGRDRGRHRHWRKDRRSRVQRERHSTAHSETVRAAGAGTPAGGPAGGEVAGPSSEVAVRTARIRESTIAATSRTWHNRSASFVSIPSIVWPPRNPW